MGQYLLDVQLWWGIRAAIGDRCTQVEDTPGITIIYHYILDGVEEISKVGALALTDMSGSGCDCGRFSPGGCNSVEVPS